MKGAGQERKQMVIKQAELDIVCGITSKLPDTGMPEVAFAGKIQRREILPDQWSDEPEVPGPYQRTAGKNTDDQLL